jgi:ubiquinone/menaquinone biosynthesis C-methylase UbiE
MISITFGRSNDSYRKSWLSAVLDRISAGKDILDVGAGELRNKPQCKHLNYISQDFCQYGGKGDGTALQTGNWDTTKIDIVSDITSIPLPDASFDVVLCTEVLEHVPDPVAALKEMCRLVKIDGQIIITVPFSSWTHFAPFHFSSGLSRYWLEKHLHEAGFNVEELSPNGGWMDFIAQELWRLPWIGRTYSNLMLGWLAIIVALPLMFVLCLMKAFERGSSELVTFGWHVVARKRST